MARYKTKKQKKKADNRISSQPVYDLNQINIDLETKPKKTSINTAKNQTTVFSKSQVNLLYKDLGKTLVVTLVVFFVLLSIFLYMR